MASYELEPWSDFFVATAGAAAALIGLLFVAISINLDRILALPDLPKRAVNTLGLLAALLLVAICGLAPGQARVAVGLEIAFIGLVCASQTIYLALTREGAPGAPMSRMAIHFVLVMTPALALVLGGITLAAGAGGGLHWVLAATVLGFTTSVVNGWVFLVEIQR